MRRSGVMPGLQRALPASYYLDEAAFRRERERLLYREWFCAGRADQVERPGSLQVVDVAGESILLVRTRAGSCAPTTTSAATAAPRWCPARPPPRAAPRPARPQGRVAALPLPLLDLPAGGRPAPGPLERGDRRLRPAGLRAPPGRGGHLGRVRVPARDPDRGGAPGRPAGPRARAAAPLPAGGAAGRAPPRLPGRGQLEAGRRELQRVLPLRRRPSPAVPGRAPFKRGGAGLDWDRGVPHREGAWTFTATGQSDRAPFPGLDDDERTRHKGELVYPNLMLSLSADHVAAFTLWPHGP